jgi:peroxiredoxin
MSDTSSGYTISKKAAALLVLLVAALLALNASLIIQNRTLRASGSAGKRSTVLHPGSSVPSLSGTDIDGKNFTLDYGNDPRKVVILVFSPRCGFCTKNMPNWRAITQSLDRNSYRIVAVSIASEGVKDYVGQQKLTDVPIIAEVDPKSRVTYEMNVTPQTILIDSHGKVEKLWTGVLSPDERNEVEQIFSLKLPEIKLTKQLSDSAGSDLSKPLGLPL